MKLNLIDLKDAEQLSACPTAILLDVFTPDNELEGFLKLARGILKTSVHDKFHRTLILSGFCLLKIAKISLNSSFFPKPIK
ncbi:hypothetical protein QR665_21245, partial [Acinetobacter gerneri]|nr:hypothetical protein [Acinetobacter gerneri]